MTDPAVRAVAEAIVAYQNEHAVMVDATELMGEAQVAVDAYRRHVLASRPDAERWESVRRFAEEDRRAAPDDVADLLAALADETAAREAAEAERTETMDRVRRLLSLPNTPPLQRLEWLLELVAIYPEDGEAAEDATVLAVGVCACPFAAEPACPEHGDLS